MFLYICTHPCMYVIRTNVAPGRNSLRRVWSLQSRSPPLPSRNPSIPRPCPFRLLENASIHQAQRIRGMVRGEALKACPISKDYVCLSVRPSVCLSVWLSSVISTWRSLFSEQLVVLLIEDSDPRIYCMLLLLILYCCCYCCYCCLYPT